MANKSKVVIGLVMMLVLGLLAFYFTRPVREASANSSSLLTNRPQIDRRGRKVIVTDRTVYKRANHERRVLTKSTPESRSLLQKLIMQLQSGDERQVIDAMIDAQELDSEDLIDFVKVALKSQDQDQREEALRMLVGVVNPRVLEVVREAIHDVNPEMRVAALEALQYIGNASQGWGIGGLTGASTLGETFAGDSSNENSTTTLENAPAEDNNELASNEDTAGEDNSVDDSEEIEDDSFDYSTLASYDVASILTILAAAFEDIDVEVRSAALQAILYLDINLQVNAFDLAQRSSYDDVRGGVLFMTATSANADTLLLAFNALDDSNESIREAARENLQLYLNTVDQEFSSSAEAIAWWKENYHLYDDDLFIFDLDNINIDESSTVTPDTDSQTNPATTQP